MTARTAPRPPAPTHSRAPSIRSGPARLERRSLLMLPAFLAASVVANVVGIWFLHLLDLHEGDLLLMAHGAAGWAAEVATTLLLLTAPVVGAVYGLAAVRAGARRAWWWLVLNGLLVAWVLFVFADDVRMSY